MKDSKNVTKSDIIFSIGLDLASDLSSVGINVFSEVEKNDEDNEE